MMPAAIVSAPPRWLWWVLGVAHLGAYAYALRTGHWFFPDSDRYLEAARNLLHHGTLYAWPWPPTSPQEYSIRPPLYPLLLAAVGVAPALFLLIQNALALLNVWLVARWLARHTPMTPRRWRIFALLVLTAPANVVYANTAMSEPVLQTLVVGLWLTLTRFFTTGHSRSLLCAALLTSAALLVKPVFMPFAFVFAGAAGIWLLVARSRPITNNQKPEAKNWFWIGLPLVVVLGWQARNYAHTGYWHFSSIADINLLRYNTRAVLRATEGPQAADTYLNQVGLVAFKLPTYAAQQEYMQHAASAALRRYWPAYLSLHLRGMANCLLDPGRFDLTEFIRLPATTPGLSHLMDAGGYRAVMAALGRQPWGLLLLLAVVLLGNLARLLAFGLFLLNHRLPLPARLVAGGLLLYVIGLTGPLGAARFLVPLLPLLWCGAGYVNRFADVVASKPHHQEG